MEIFETVEKFNDNAIILTSKEELSSLYELITKEDNFILSFKGKSEVIIASNLCSKFKNGELKLTAVEK